ncbi:MULTISPECIES: hypothetical protein [Microbacterium]|uniref:DUF1579 domain-containing protein n=1 Tax=Microbacterium wangchenii TaxID=2541726 RepID=A0ABX5SMR6_9MICO|nr:MULTISPECIES: hypothetical protein [Microbacterium]MCK6066451.1 hypothetical protein [Microbacterium sp. EYE_512]QBR87413.1 hypothetical protein E4K62_01060 [Microbacterium wangchenii]TXK14735.1 hypothetical protein FVP99_13640 [Microbacterium wangchenii]
MTGDSTLQDQLDRLVGTWRTEGIIVGGSEHGGHKWAGWDVYEWFPGARQMVHRVDVEIFGARKEAMEFFTPREASMDTFDQTSFDADGTVEHAVGSFDEHGRYLNDAGDAPRHPHLRRPGFHARGVGDAAARWRLGGVDAGEVHPGRRPAHRGAHQGRPHDLTHDR